MKQMRRFVYLAIAMLLSLWPAAAQTTPPLELPTLVVQRTPQDLAAIAAQDAFATPATLRDARAVSHVQIPLTIKVGITPFAHCSDWLAAGRPITNIVEMDLKTYIKNVLPNEWPNAWHAESLKAGAVAAKMFAWWRINLTETYDGIRPPGVHVVDNTCDQVYFANSHRPTTDAAIDATWPLRMTDAERVVEIHYLAWDWQCANAFAAYGGGWKRCMGQNESKMLAENGMGYQDILQTYYAPMQFSVTTAMPQKKNVLLNPKFSLGMQSWFTQGGVADAGITDGVFRFHRATESAEPATVFQDANVIVSANSPLKLMVKLGNTSAVQKTVRLRIRPVHSATDATDCTFTLAAGAPLLSYSVVGVNPTGWMGARVAVSVISADGQSGVTVDDVSLKLIPTQDTAIPCLTPRPGKPVMTSPTAAQALRSPFVIALTEGASNHVVGYAPAWHVQVDNNSDFSSPFYDNADSLSSEPSITVAVSAGTWYVRARQYDGVGMFSAWTPKIPVSVSQKPAAPVQLAPIGDAVAGGQSFVWQTSNLATKYRLVVKNAAGLIIFRQALTPVDWGCAADSCAVALDSLGVPFVSGEPYTWRVVAVNPNGTGASKFQAFRLIEVNAAPAWRR